MIERNNRKRFYEENWTHMSKSLLCIINSGLFRSSNLIWKIQTHLLESVIEYLGFSERKGVFLFYNLQRQWILFLATHNYQPKTVSKGDRFVSTSRYFFSFPSFVHKLKINSPFFGLLSYVAEWEQKTLKVSDIKRNELKAGDRSMCFNNTEGLRRVLITLDASRRLPHSKTNLKFKSHDSALSFHLVLMTHIGQSDFKK